MDFIYSDLKQAWIILKLPGAWVYKGQLKVSLEPMACVTVSHSPVLAP